MNQAMKVFMVSDLQPIEIGKCIVGGTYYHRKFDDSRVVIDLMAIKDNIAICKWRDVRFPDDIKSSIELKSDYKVLQAIPIIKEGSKMALICDVCKKKHNELHLDINDGLSKCFDCFSTSGSKRTIMRSSNKDGAKSTLIKIKGKRGEPPRLVECSTLMVDYDKYLTLSRKEQGAAIKCIVDQSVLSKILEHEKEAGHKGKIKRCLRRIKRLGRR
jgi:hypothetical protein